ncbi:MAG TPA: P22 phage major capsid protein family protein [Candidatus Hydrothermia bacterium]|nr:P22 phage major capsid protein family protein [Candidatus Hydrothermia bacterium]
MMQSIEEFSGITSSKIRWEPYLEKMILEEIEALSNLRDICFPYRISGTFTANIPKSQSTGKAVEAVEATEIPAVRQVISTADVKVVANATAIEFSDEAEIVDLYGDLMERELKEAAKRMVRKENEDIINTLIAGAGSQTNGLYTQITYEDITYAKAYLRKQGINPDTVLVGPDEYAQLLNDVRVLTLSDTNEQAYNEGRLNARIAGMRLVEVPEMPPKTVIVMDTSVNPLWLVLLDDMKVEAFRDYDRRTKKVQMIAYEKPAVLRPEAIRKIILQ